MRWMVLVCLFTGCALAKPLSTQPTNNEEITIEKLFDHDGCTVYRWRDGNLPRYYAKCSGATTVTTAWDGSCGKSCRVERSLETVNQ